MKKLLLFLFYIAPFSLAFAQEKPAAVVLSPAEFEQKLTKEEVQLIDVRTPEEFEVGHVNGAVNIDYKSEEFLEKMQQLDKEKPLFLYCRSGNRSGKAAVLLSKNGFEHITDLKGGYLAWEVYLKEKE